MIPKARIQKKLPVVNFLSITILQRINSKRTFLNKGLIFFIKQSYFGRGEFKMSSDTTCSKNFY